jgi:NAD(P)H-dependent FMN reductase
MARLTIIIGSTRPGRAGLPIATWFADRARSHGAFDVDLVDLAELDLPLLDEPNHPRLRRYTQQHTKDWSATVDAGDAFVIVTPEYNHSYPAPLKAVIDAHFREWLGKPVGFVSYGGLSGGLRAVEHLRPVFAELHAVTVRDTVSFHGGRSCFGPDGLPLDLAGPAAAAHLLLDRLTWWGLSLRDAHRARPYAAA